VRVFQQKTRARARARSAGHVATPDPPGGVLRPTRPGVRVVCGGPGPGWGGGPGTPFAGTECLCQGHVATPDPFPSGKRIRGRCPARGIRTFMPCCPAF